MDSLQTLIRAITTVPNSKNIIELGGKVGRLYTDKGLPVDMALAEMEKKGYDEQAKILLIYGVGQWLIEHRRNSGASDKAIERQRKINRRMLDDYLKTGETGIY